MRLYHILDDDGSRWVEADSIGVAVGLYQREVFDDCDGMYEILGDVPEPDSVTLVADEGDIRPVVLRG